MKTTPDISLYQLCQATKSYVEHARELARGGHKDEARNWLRFFSNGNVIHLCESYEGFPPFDVAALKAEIAQLEHEVHPATRCDANTEYQRLRRDVSSIAFGVQKILERLPR